jgi:uncharacterized surface protein with fasciclin (FAS1) repeats
MLNQSSVGYLEENIMKRNVLLTLITVVLALALATPAFAGPPDRTTISDIAESNGYFIILWAALQTSGLDSVLDDKGQYTVFAPTDAAFAAALSELNITADQLLASEDLTNILLCCITSCAAIAIPAP